MLNTLCSTYIYVGTHYKISFKQKKNWIVIKVKNLKRYQSDICYLLFKEIQLKYNVNNFHFIVCEKAINHIKEKRTHSKWVVHIRE